MNRSVLTAHVFCVGRTCWPYLLSYAAAADPLFRSSIYAGAQQAMVSPIPRRARDWLSTGIRVAESTFLGDVRRVPARGFRRWGRVRIPPRRAERDDIGVAPRG